MSGAKGLSPLVRLYFSFFFFWVEEGAGILSPPYHHNFIFFSATKGLEAGMIPKEES